MRTLLDIVGYLFIYAYVLFWLGVLFSVVTACVGVPIALGVKLWRAMQEPPPPPHSVSVAEPFAVRSGP